MINLDEIRGRYPEMKPVVLNYATVRDDVLLLAEELERLRGESNCSLCALYVRDNDEECEELAIHRVGEDSHDCLYVKDDGIVRYYNLQNGCGTPGTYSFVPRDPLDPDAWEEDGYDD